MNQVPVQQPQQRVVVTDVSMTFPSMISFMVKWAIASIPAMLILSMLAGALSLLFLAVFAALGIAASH